jgi:hypothetical protein
MKRFDLETIISSESPVRANVFREMVEVARHQGDPRYSDNLDHMAVVLTFCPVRRMNPYDSSSHSRLHRPYTIIFATLGTRADTG